MLLRFGCELGFDFGAPTPMILRLSPHPSVAARLEGEGEVVAEPAAPLHPFTDAFGNRALRCVAPAGGFALRASGAIRDDGRPDPAAPEAGQAPPEALPEAVLPFLLGSRYVESDRLAGEAWRLFSHLPPGWARAQAISDFVFETVDFGYEFARGTRTAAETYAEGRGVCRDMAHLALAFLRGLNIPARYCTGYLSEVGLARPDPPMDFTAWTEAWLGGAWHVFDPRNHAPRIGRILVAVGRDAADAPLTHGFGRNRLTKFRVWTDPA